MNKKTAFVCAAVFCVQCAAGFSMIASRELILAKGTRVLMTVQPVDPYDPMRGRYVSLRPDMKEPESAHDSNGQTGPSPVFFAVLGLDEQGFSRVVSYETKRPRGKTYLAVRRHYGAVEWPVDRYYVREDLGPKADAYMSKIAWGALTAEKAYIAARVLNGELAIEGLYFDGKPFEDTLKKEGLNA